MNKYDVIVLGGGAGGLTVTAGAASMGAKVALVEKDEQPGGDCLHYGCVPSKALIESAKKVYAAKHAAQEFGLHVSGKADLSVAKQRLKAAIAHIQVHDDADRFRRLGVDVYHSFGTFVGQHQIKLESGEIIEGKRIVIATGSRAAVPPIEGINDVDYVTNKTIFEWEEAPQSLVVIGGGPIGLELAQSLSRFGSQVTVMEFAPTIFGQEDPDLIPLAQEALEKEATILLGTKVLKVEQSNDGVKTVTYKKDGLIATMKTDALLVAAGRTPNTDQIGLDEIGVHVKRGYIQVKPTLQTNIPHIYAVGDVIADFPFTHAAGMEGKIVVGNAVFGLKRKVNYTHVPWVTYIDPEVYHLGLTEPEAREKHGEGIQVYKIGTNEVDRFVADRDLDGLLKVITDSKGYILGAHAIAKGASDWMQEIVFAKQHGHKMGGISNVIHPYPTHGAILQQTADKYWRKKLFEGSLSTWLRRYVRWFR